MKEEDRQAIKGTIIEDQELKDFLEMEQLAEATEKEVQDNQLLNYENQVDET
jgi:hypothetical protein